MQGFTGRRNDEPRTITVDYAAIYCPVSIAEIKHHVRVEHTDDDSYIYTLVQAATEWCEKKVDRYFLQTRLSATWDYFPYEIRLPKPPIYKSNSAVTIFYRDSSQNEILLPASEYRIEHGDPGVLRPNYAGTWPSAISDVNSVKVSWNAGYGTNGMHVPIGIRHAILMLAGHLYERRLAYDSIAAIEVPMGVNALLMANSWGSYR
jgi:uncharacterized phiE125 gp8 family phage protein